MKSPAKHVGAAAIWLSVWGVFTCVVVGVGLYASRQDPHETLAGKLSAVQFSLTAKDTTPNQLVLFGNWGVVTDSDVEAAFVLMSKADPPISIDEVLLVQALITDDGLGHLKHMPSVRALDLSGTHITDNAFMHIFGLPRLEQLDLTAVRSIDGSGLSHLKKDAQLKEITLRATSLEGKYVSLLASCRHLRKADLGRTAVSDDDLECIESFTQLETLLLDSTNITDVTVQRLARLPNLRELHLQSNPGITDESVRLLGAMRTLRELEISGTSISNSGYRTLVGQLPACLVTRTPSP